MENKYLVVHGKSSFMSNESVVELLERIQNDYIEYDLFQIVNILPWNGMGTDYILYAILKLK